MQRLFLLGAPHLPNPGALPRPHVDRTACGGALRYQPREHSVSCNQSRQVAIAITWCTM